MNDESRIENRDEAEKCRDMAKRFMSQGEYAKAAKFFDKSLRLYPLPGVKSLKEKAEELEKEQTSGESTSGGGSSPRSSANSSYPRLFIFLFFYFCMVILCFVTMPFIS